MRLKLRRKLTAGVVYSPEHEKKEKPPEWYADTNMATYTTTTRVARVHTADFADIELRVAAHVARLVAQGAYDLPFTQIDEATRRLGEAAGRTATEVAEAMASMQNVLRRYSAVDTQYTLPDTPAQREAQKDLLYAEMYGMGVVRAEALAALMESDGTV